MLRPPAPGKQLPGRYLPSAFSVRIGGFPGPYYSVSLRGESLLYWSKVLEPGGTTYKESTKVITPTADWWQQFWKAMDEVRPWRWRPSYPNPSLADGTQWGLEIAVAGLRIRSSGSNAYPGAESGPGDPPRPDAPPTSEAFEKYLKAVRALLGDEPFG